MKNLKFCIKPLTRIKEVVNPNSLRNEVSNNNQISEQRIDLIIRKPNADDEIAKIAKTSGVGCFKNL